MRKTRAAIALLATFSIVAAACGDDDKDSTTTTAAPEATTGETGATETTAAGETDYMWTPNADLLAGAEGNLNFVAWAG